MRHVRDALLWVLLSVIAVVTLAVLVSGTFLIVTDLLQITNETIRGYI